MSQTVEQTLNESIPVRPQAEESRGARAGRLTDAQMYDIMGPRDTGKAWLKGAAMLYFFSLILPLGLMVLCLYAEVKESSLAVLFLVWFWLGVLCAIGGTGALIASFWRNWIPRERRMELYDAIQRGEIEVDFHFPYKTAGYGCYLIVTKDGRVCLPDKIVPLKDLHQVSTREKYAGESRKLHLRLSFRNLAEPIQTICMNGEHNLEQQYARLLNYLGWN